MEAMARGRVGELQGRRRRPRLNCFLSMPVAPLTRQDGPYQSRRPSQLEVEPQARPEGHLEGRLLEPSNFGHARKGTPRIMIRVPEKTFSGPFSTTTLL